MLKNYFDLNLETNQFPNFKTMHELIEYCNIQYPNRNFIIDKGISYTYHEVYQKIYQTTNILMKPLVLKKQDTIGIYYDNGIDFIVASLSAMNAGLSAVLLPSNIPLEQIMNIVYIYQIKSLCLSFKAHQDWLLQNKKQYSYIGCSVMDLGAVDMLLNNTNTYINQQQYDYNYDENTTAAILFTSGTEGQPQGVELTHKNILTGMRNGLLGFKEAGYNEDGQIYQLTVPLTHSFGLIRNLLCCMITGSTLIISKDNKTIFNDMQKYNPTRLVTVPGFCDIIIHLMQMGKTNIVGEKLEYIITGGATLSNKTIQSLKSLQIPIYNGYGMTETSNLCTGNPYHWDLQNFIGYIYPDSEYKISEDGELLIKGDNVFKKYFRQNDNPFDAEGFFHTGDLVQLDETTQLLKFVGRKSQKIVLDSGINIIPTIIEQIFLDNIDYIDECYIYSPDNKILECHIYSKAEPEDKSAVFALNKTLTTKINRFVFIKNPLPKTNKMEIQRGK